jgi:DNA ligase-1
VTIAGMADDEEEVEGGGEEGAQESKLADGGSVEVEGSSSTYTLTRHGGTYMCSCPAWKNQSAPTDMRTCKHLRGYLGEDFETARLGALPSRAASTKSGGGSGANKKETAPPVLLAHKWEIDHDPKGWWMSEKLDGLRAYWDGETFVSRLGNRFFAPDWFVEDLPADTLDGELWVGRKMFQKATSIVRSGAAGQEWKNVQFVVFDAPNAKGSFEDRQLHAQKVLERAAAPHARWHDHVLCEGFDHLREELARVEALGGEGLMLRQPGSKYISGRSSTLLKVKTFHDAEATVIGHAPGTGKHKGRLGALIARLPGGVTFNVGTGFSDHERENPPDIGAVITFRYQELSDDGVPRFPSYVGERLDVDTPQPIAKSSRAIQTVPLAKGTGAKSSGAKTTAPETRAAAKVKAPPPPDDDEEIEEPDDDEPAPKKMQPAPKLESAGADLARGKKFMFTGKLAGMMRDQAQKKVTSIGGVNAGSVSADLDYLVVGDDGSPLFGAGAKGDKILKAEKLINQGSALKIISETEFVKMCDRTVAAPKPDRPKVELPPKPKRLPDPDDDEDEDEGDEPAPRKMQPAPKLESAGADLARGKKFMFTGKLAGMQRSQAQQKVTSIGGVNAGSVSADLDFLVVGDDGSPLFGAGAKGDKILKAEKLINQGSRLKIISETEFVKMCDRTVAAPKPDRPKVELPPKPKRLPEPDDDEEEEDDEDDDEPVAASAAQPEADDGPFAKYGPVTWQCKLTNEDEGKFWNIEVRGKVHVTVFGKIGSPGQTRLSDIGSATAAKSDADKRAIQKRKEGYE